MIMKFDTKQKILTSIYVEYQKDKPNMDNNIRFNVLEIEKEVFEIALNKLDNEGMITGVNFIRGGGKILSVFTNNIMMTPEGIEYVETKIGLSNVLTGKEKVEFIFKNAVSWGIEQLKDVAAKTLAEMNKQ